MVSRYNAMAMGAVVIFFGFHGGFRRPETQPQAAKRIILKIKIRDLVWFGAACVLY